MPRKPPKPKAGHTPLRITLPDDLWEDVKQASGPVGLSRWFEQVLRRDVFREPDSVTSKARTSRT